MDTSLQVDILKQFEKPFNWRAFVFGPLYFLVKGLPAQFMVFLLLPCALVLPFLLVWDTMLCWVPAVLISNTIAGFVANPSCRNQLEQYLKEHGNIDTTKPVEFYAVSVKRVVILTILSCGVYLIYWSFRNWNAYQKTTNVDINPYMRAFFFHLTMPWLFARMNDTLKSKKPFFFYGWLVLIFLVTMRVISKLDEQGQNLELFFIYMACFFIYPFIFVPIQKTVNAYTTDVLKKEVDKKFHFWEAVFVCLGILLNVFPFFEDWENPLKAYTEKQQYQIAASAGYIYRHTQVYPMVCTDAGYTMKNYPYEFRSYFKQEIKSVEEVMAISNTTIEKLVLNYGGDELVENIKASVYSEIDEFRRFLILRSMVEENQTDKDMPEWSPEYNNLLTMGETCEFFDYNGLEMLLNSPKKDFLKNHAL